LSIVILAQQRKGHSQLSTVKDKACVSTGNFWRLKYQFESVIVNLQRYQFSSYTTINYTVSGKKLIS